MKQLLILATLLTAAACDKGGDEPRIPDTTPDGTAQIDANSYTDWVYFSFDNGSIPTPSDPAASLDWDIAFHLWDMKTNGGASGPGQGAAYRATGLLEALLPPDVRPNEALFVKDATIRTFMSTPTMSGGPPEFEQQKVAVPGNTELAAWIGITFWPMPPKISWEESVWWVRTADGDYVLMQITDYMNDAGDEFKFYPKFNYWFR